MKSSAYGTQKTCWINDLKKKTKNYMLHMCTEYVLIVKCALCIFITIDVVYLVLHSIQVTKIV